MAEIDKGTCGECYYYQPKEILVKEIGKTSGFCMNFSVPAYEVTSTDTPRDVLEDVLADNELEEFLETDTTCFAKDPIFFKI